MADDYLKNALNDFAHDLASGDAIRHLADKGMTVKEIQRILECVNGMDEGDPIAE